MPDNVTFFQAINNSFVGNEYDPFRIFYRKGVCNTPLTPVGGKGSALGALSMCAGQGLLPVCDVSQPAVKPVAQAVMSVAQLFTPACGKIYAGKAKFIAAEEASLPPKPSPPAKSSLPPEPSPADSAYGYVSAVCSRVDTAVSGLLNRFMFWQPALAQESTLTPADSVPSFPVANSHPSTWLIHDHRDDPALFRQQLETFLQRIDIQLSENELQKLIATLRGHDMIFFLPPDRAHGRVRRVHEDVARSNTMLYEMSIKDKGVAKESIGAKLIAFGNQQMEYSLLLFERGIQEYDVRYFVASGGEAILGYFSQVLGELFSGTLFDPHPGESNGDWLQRLALNVVSPPSAGNAFRGPRIRVAVNRPRVGRPRPQPAFAVSAAGSRQGLTGIVNSHPHSGITVQSVLQADIAGQRWHLFPNSQQRATAVQPGVTPVVSHAATRVGNTNLWRIDGLSGEYAFSYGARPNLYLNTPEGLQAVKVSADDGTLLLTDGQKIWFEPVTGEWRLFWTGNTHLTARCLPLIPEPLISTTPGATEVLASVLRLERRVWATANGRQYLEIRSPALNPNSEVTGYVEGHLEGNFFTVTRRDTLLHQQPVLSWQPTAEKWDAAASPFSLLNAAENHIDFSWLQPRPDAARLTAVYQRPGLYRHGHHYFLRWRTDAAGVSQYLAVTPAEKPAFYRPVEPLAADIRLHYHEQQQQWQLRTLTHPAFAGLPESVKVQPAQPFSPADELPWYQHMYRQGGDLWLHTGTDKQGAPEYVRVVQDSEDSDLFTLREPESDGAESVWRVRYHDDDEITLEEQRCQRRKRADDQPCAGPSSQEQPAAKIRRVQQIDAAGQRWLEQHPRESQEIGQSGDTLDRAHRRNLRYARRLLQLARATKLPRRVIAHHAGVTERELAFWLQQLSPEAERWLVDHPQHDNETDLAYAVRLWGLQQQERSVSLGDISRHTGIEARSILNFLLAESVSLKTRLQIKLPPQGSEADAGAADSSARESSGRDVRPKATRTSIRFREWLSLYPRDKDESLVDYAVRLSLNYEGNVSSQMIADYLGVDIDAMMQRRDELALNHLSWEEERQWFRATPRKPGESELDYATRLYFVREQQSAAGMVITKISNNRIASFAGTSAPALNRNISRLRKVTIWMNNHPPRAQEDEFLWVTDSSEMGQKKQYALRLFRERAVGNQRKTVTLDDIAQRLDTSKPTLQLWLNEAREAWFRDRPRQDEKVSGNANDLFVQRANQFYARRLAGLRAREQMAWLIRDRDIATHAGITPESLKFALEADFERKNPLPERPFSEEEGWDPAYGRLHLNVRKNPPLLVDASDPTRSVTHEVISPEARISDFEQLVSRAPKAHQERIRREFPQQAQRLIATDGGEQDSFIDAAGNRQQGPLSRYFYVMHDAQNPELGAQVRAKERVPAWTFLGGYTGVLHRTEASLRNEFKKIGSQASLTYLWATKGEASVSGFLNANILALMNTAKMDGFDALGKNNVIMFYIEDIVIGYCTVKDVEKDEQLLVDYGKFYQPDYEIQTTLNNDIIRLIAQAENTCFIVKDIYGQMAHIYGPNGAVDAVPENVPSHILQERKDARGIIRYDVVNKKGGKIFYNRKHDAWNLYRTLAKALYPNAGRDMTEQKIHQMQAVVAGVYPQEEGAVKPEPDDER